ncbi:hypothetical protein BDF22DRAFT_656829 [Syncephalis plumigaleata]|nr:hypothetical protein BDF22DRAFT_656829 [Syncephalis plumigaleata]
MRRAEVTIDTNTSEVDTGRPENITINNELARLYWTDCEPACRYCRKTGHRIDKCPALAAKNEKEDRRKQPKTLKDDDATTRRQAPPRATATAKATTTPKAIDIASQNPFALLTNASSQSTTETPEAESEELAKRRKTKRNYEDTQLPMRITRAQSKQAATQKDHSTNSLPAPTNVSGETEIVTLEERTDVRNGSLASSDGAGQAMEETPSATGPEGAVDVNRPMEAGFDGGELGEHQPNNTLMETNDNGSDDPNGRVLQEFVFTHTIPTEKGHSTQLTLTVPNSQPMDAQMAEVTGSTTSEHAPTSSPPPDQDDMMEGTHENQ